ncbi:MAG: hypothetical protein R3191_06100 [Anaerolineales bacterium]|nr:hypothetical protein [Anaerolineales bacterium]
MDGRGRSFAIALFSLWFGVIACGGFSTAVDPTSVPGPSTGGEPGVPALHEVRTATIGPTLIPAVKDLSNREAVSPPTLSPTAKSTETEPAPTLALIQPTTSPSPEPPSTARPTTVPRVVVTNWEMGSATNLREFTITEPTSVFTPDQDVYIKAEFQVEADGNVPWRAVWIGPDGGTVQEWLSDFDPGYSGWFLDAESPVGGWDPGTYEVRLFAAGEPVHTWNYEVVAD